MEHRDFIKGVIGFIAGTQIPWKAQSPVYKHPSINKTLAHKIRALHLKQRNLKLFKGVCVLENGQEIYAPKVKQIKTQQTEFGHCSLVAWKFVAIELKQHVKVIKIRLIDDMGFLIVEHDLDKPIQGQPGNSIHLQDITINLI